MEVGNCPWRRPKLVKKYTTYSGVKKIKKGSKTSGILLSG